MNPATFSVACALVRAETSNAFAVLNDQRFVIVAETGYYPRVRAVREGAWTLSLDFWMALDPVGQYRTEWRGDTPFELGGTAAVTRQEGDDLVRYSRSHVLYTSRPYNIALQTLEADLMTVAEVIGSWSEETIVSTGRRMSIRQRPMA
jgi:hypothetical protein